ncbi:MAG: HAD-superfamily hydrolase, subfamily variant 3 [Gemmatimonadetes bacterium]|nr:HAD-superfamily hydrolase, subfamily variant 3 [Gemmatimonadota bacterium]
MAGRPLVASAVLFDLDGVLADSTASVSRSWGAWARRVGLDPDEVLAKVHGRRAMDTVRALRPNLDAEVELAFLVALETTDNHDVVPIPGARELLQALPADAWAVVTSGTRAVATSRLVAAGIPLPRVMISGESVSRGKPDPEGYLLGAASLGVAAAECIVVEDAPAGAAAARAAGMLLLALTTTHAASELQPADLVISDLSHLSLRQPAPSGHRLELRARP